MAKSKILRITQVKSGIGYKAKAKATLKALGLRNMHQTVELSDDEMDSIIESKIFHTVDRGDSMYNTDVHSDCYGDDYADCVMSDLIMDA